VDIAVDKYRLLFYFVLSPKNTFGGLDVNLESKSHLACKVRPLIFFRSIFSEFFRSTCSKEAEKYNLKYIDTSMPSSAERMPLTHILPEARIAQAH
jgi:hypothetical protein